MYIGWRRLLGLIVLAPLAAVFVAWIGFFNIGAASGHWPITEWFLHYAMRQAVSTYSLAVERPDSPDPALLVPAAGHYAQGCAMCHGAPGEPRSATVLEMLPPPPNLQTLVGTWTDEELFRIVEHGVRFSGMPAWPSLHREDEVWGMVMFLRELPKLDAGSYRALTNAQPFAQQSAEPAALDGALQRCAACHGMDGMGRSAAIPILAGQSETYLLASLHAYRTRQRASGYMQSASTAVDEALFADLARYFAQQPGLPASAKSISVADDDLLRDGQIIAEAGIPTANVPACLSCHGERRNPVFPIIDGQSRSYIVRQLRLFDEGHRGGTSYSQLMTKAVSGLNEEQRRAVAAYFEARGR